MLPVILAAVGGYLVYDSLKSKKFADGGEAQEIWDSGKSVKNTKWLSFAVFKNKLGYNTDEILELTFKKFVELPKDVQKALESVMPVFADGGMMAKGGLNESFSVATFESDEIEEVVEGGLSYDDALLLAKKLWDSGKYYGVEVIDDDPNNMESIVWIKSKYSGKMADGGEIYSLAENMTDDEYEKKLSSLNVKQKKTYESLVRLGDSPKLALATTLLSKEVKWSDDTTRAYTMAKGGYVTDLDEVVASSDLKEKLKSKMNKGDAIVAFSYTDYGGSFGDKVAIEYFKENHPKNIVFEKAAYNGQNGIIFGEVAKDFLEETEDYPLGYEDMESFYYDMQNAQEKKDFKLFLSDIKNKYTIKKDALDWLLENKSGYYSIEPNMVDFSYSDLENELEEEGLIKKKKM